MTARYFGDIKIFFALMFLASPPLYARVTENPEPPLPHEGNFLVPTSQQVSPLISFGQNILNAEQFQLYVMGDKFIGGHSNLEELIPSAIYAFTDNSSVYLNVPAMAQYKHNNKRSSGWEDIFLQFEYAVYNGQTSAFADQATIVANTIVPTGATKKDPPMGDGSYRFLLGGTFSRMYVDWYGFTSQGTILSAARHGSKPGNQYLYQFGLGRYLFNIQSSWIVAFLVEADGQYSEKNRFWGRSDPDSGGNIITLTPSLWVASEKVIIQLGIGFYPVQKLNGAQDKEEYFLAASLGWTF